MTGRPGVLMVQVRTKYVLNRFRAYKYILLCHSNFICAVAYNLMISKSFNRVVVYWMMISAHKYDSDTY